jgi:branched-chain amino acid transport system permease protein
MGFLVAQFLTGLANAASLFLVAAGLSIIFGVTRIVNFAHGAFYMAGAYVAYTLTERLSGGLGFWGGLILASLAVAALGALVEMLLLRRLYQAPELFQLLATFGLTLMVEDLVVIVWGPDDLVGRRAPGFRGAVEILGQQVPSYDLLLIVLGPLVLALLWLLFHRTRFGVLVRAATQDREMVASLGVNQQWLFTGVFALGVGLAAFGGAVQLPRDAVNHGMDLSIIVEAFVIVVIGGLGSLPGAFVAAVIVSELNAFGILILPRISLVLVFLVMAVVLVIRPWGLFGKPDAVLRAPAATAIRPWRPLVPRERLGLAVLVIAAALLPLVAGPYLMTIGAEILIFAIFAMSLQFLMSGGGLASFGHAAYFGLGAYAVAFLVKHAGFATVPALAVAPLAGLVGAALFGWFSVRLAGVYLAMLTLAFAQIVWSLAFQWVSVTGGDNGVLGVWPDAWLATPVRFYELSLLFAVVLVAALRRVLLSPFGYALRALRDAPLRADSLGLDRIRIQWAAFMLSGAVAALAGGLYAVLKGSVFPDVLGIPQSIDGLVMVLLGGVGTMTGGVAGALVYKTLTIWLMSQTDWSKLVLGGVIVLLVVACPKGILGFAGDLLHRRTSPPEPAGRTTEVRDAA